MQLEFIEDGLQSTSCSVMAEGCRVTIKGVCSACAAFLCANKACHSERRVPKVGKSIKAESFQGQGIFLKAVSISATPTVKALYCRRCAPGRGWLDFLF